MKDFSALELKALEVYHLPENTPNEKVLDVINNQGIKTWEQCLTLLTDLQKLDLPLNIQNRNEVLKQYCRLRINCYKIISKAVSENTNQYKPQIDSCNAQIDRTINSLAE